MRREIDYVEIYEINWHAVRCLTAAMLVSCAMWGGIIRALLALVN